jgi:lysozyme
MKYLSLIFLFFVTFNVFSQSKIENEETKRNVWGIDLSHHQGEINWKSVSDDNPHFVFLKATEGVTIIDKQYHHNYREARENGILTGSYHFFSYKSSGLRQAMHFLSVVKYQKGDLPLVLDAEFGRNMPPDMVVARELNDFIQTVSRITGEKILVYCQDRYYNRYLKKYVREPHHLWICDFVGTPDSDEWLFWQQTDKFKIGGIAGGVDFNIFNGSIDKLRSLRKI